jgi:hypothetical protein
MKSSPGLETEPSDFQPLATPSDAVENKAIPHNPADGRSAGRSGQQDEGGISDPDLATLVAAWPTLPAHIRAAVRALVGIAEGRTDADPKGL